MLFVVVILLLLLRLLLVVARDNVVVVVAVLVILVVHVACTLALPLALVNDVSLSMKSCCQAFVY